jgi:hypothetical protein
VTGLTNGTAYTFTATATNSVGTSAASSAVTATPVGAPDAPTNLVTTPGDGSVKVAFTPPANNGGSPITGYTVTATSGNTTVGTCTPDADTMSCSITGLTNGTAYPVTVSATNHIGTSTATATATPATVPDAPTGVTAVPGDGSAKVTITPPANDGGAPITSYEVTATDTAEVTPSAVRAAAAQTCTIHPPATSCTVTGLINGHSYTFTATATNSVGTSSASTASAPVTPVAGPVTTPPTGPGTPGTPPTTPPTHHRHHHHHPARHDDPPRCPRDTPNHGFGNAPGTYGNNGNGNSGSCNNGSGNRGNNNTGNNDQGYNPEHWENVANDLGHGRGWPSAAGQRR